MRVKKDVPHISYHQWEVDRLRNDPEFAVEYLKMALASLDHPEERAGSLLMLRAVAEASGGLAAIAAQAGLSRESLYRTLSPKGNPTLKTLIAILNAMNLRLSVVPAPVQKAAARKKTARKPRQAVAKPAAKPAAKPVRKAAPRAA